MHRAQPRRQFLKYLAVGTGAAAVASAPGPLAAIEPIRRTGSSKLKLSLAAYSYRDLLTAKPPKLRLEDFISDCARMNLDGVELTSYYLPQMPTPAYLRGLKQRCFLEGLEVSGTAIGNSFCHRKGAERDRQLAYVKGWIDHAEILGAPVIRIFAGEMQNLSKAEAHKLVVAGIEECCQYAGEHGVMLALENHGGLTAEAKDMLAVVRDVRSTWFGVNLDTGNFHTADLYGELAQLAPYAVNVQVKVSVSGPDGKRRGSDFDRLASILRAAGYRGYVVLEYEEPEDPRTACPQHIQRLRGAMRTTSQA